MPAVFSRIHNWVSQVLTSADINAEFNNILANLDPTGVGDYSATVPQMQLQTSPGGLGSESLAASLGGEIERLRYVIQRIIGTSTKYWYQAGPTDLTTLVNSIGSQLSTTRLISGPTTGNSSQLLALLPGAGTGTAANVILSVGVTPLVYAIGSQNYTISVNQTVSGLSLAPSTNNNCVLANFGFNGLQWTKMAGQYGTQINCTSVGSSVPLATMSAFLNGTEIFLANASATALSSAWRGSFFNSASARIEAATMQTSGTVSVLKLAWIFANSNGSLAVTYTNPTISAAQPTSPNAGDYWYNTGTLSWMFYISSWQTAAVVPLGICAQGTAACLGARTFDTYVSPSAQNELQLDYGGTASVIDHGIFSTVQVFGTKLNFGATKTNWNIPGNLGDSLSVSPNTTYFMYLSENGSPSITDKFPLQRKDLLGLYHPHETWRCIGSVKTDNSTNFSTFVKTFRGTSQTMLLADPEAYYANGGGIPLNGPAMAFPTRFIQHSSDGDGTVFGPILNANPFDMATISLTPGFWRIDAAACAELTSGTATMSYFTIGLGTAQGTATFSPTFGRNGAQVTFCGATASFVALAGSNPSFAYLHAQGTAPTTYYFKGQMSAVLTASSVVSLIGWNIMAQRIDDSIGGPA